MRRERAVVHIHRPISVTFTDLDGAMPSGGGGSLEISKEFQVAVCDVCLNYYMASLGPW